MTRLLALVILTVGTLFIISCDETMQPIVDSVLDTDPEPITVAEVKQPDETEESSEPEEPQQPEEVEDSVIEISYYRDWNFTEQLTDSVEVGESIYTRIVFSGAPPTEDVLSNIFFSVAGKASRYRMRSRDVNYADLQTGDIRPYENTEDSFICKYVVPSKDLGLIFVTYVGNRSVSGDFLQIILFTYTVDEPTDHRPVVHQNQQDFVGLVCIPKVSEEIRDGEIFSTGREQALPVPNATVTIMSGPRTGEYVSTNQWGEYIFLNVEEDELHLLVEKKFFEPKEVVASRFGPTLVNGEDPYFHHDPQRNPGTILIGLAWPEEVRFILQQTHVVNDLLYIGQEPPLKEYRGLYSRSSRVIKVAIDRGYGADTILTTFAHEIAHAHQDAVRISLGEIQWENTPEGKTYIEAMEKDWDEVGKFGFDGLVSTHENFANFCSRFWGRGRWKVEYENLDVIAPNRFKWAEEWLSKSYP